MIRWGLGAFYGTQNYWGYAEHSIFQVRVDYFHIYFVFYPIGNVSDLEVLIEPDCIMFHFLYPPPPLDFPFVVCVTFPLQSDLLTNDSMIDYHDGVGW